MKKTIIIEIILIFILATLIYATTYFWQNISGNLKLIEQNVFGEIALKGFYNGIIAQLPYAILTLLSCISTLTAIILIAIKDFPAFQPLRDKLNARKQARKEVKAQKAEANKQARIEALQNELDQLKKDE